MAATGTAMRGLSVGTLLGGKFRVERFLGAGAMGAVYEVVDPEGRRFAAKTLLQSADMSGSPETLARFVRESGRSGSLSSPHIVSIVHAAVDPKLGVPFFVMSLLSGLDLDALIERVGPLHPTVAVRIIVQACRGLSDAHAQGVIHRDIKPSNVFLDHAPDGRITVKICDFGIAKWTLAREDITQSGSICACQSPSIRQSPDIAGGLTWADV